MQSNADSTNQLYKQWNEKMVSAKSTWLMCANYILQHGACLAAAVDRLFVVQTCTEYHVVGATIANSLARFVAETPAACHAAVITAWATHLCACDDVAR